MDEMMEFRNLRRIALNELRTLDTQYADKQEFSDADAKKYDCLMHGLKCQLTAEAMLQAEDYEMEGMSGRRGRSSVTGRYVSRDGGQSYAEGYSQGYNEGMSQQRSGNRSYESGYSQGYSEGMSQRSGNRSFESGYSQGYSEGMRQSGHYPMIYPRY